MDQNGRPLEIEDKVNYRNDEIFYRAKNEKQQDFYHLLEIYLPNVRINY